jgi:hypothetical protein
MIDLAINTVPCKLKLLVKIPLQNSLYFEIRYMFEGRSGSPICGRMISAKKTKLSSLIHLIHSHIRSLPA